MGVELLIRVECRSEGGAEQRPVAVRLGGSRVAIRGIVRDALVASPVAGEPSRRRMRVELEDGRELELWRTIPDGRWRAAPAREV